MDRSFHASYNWNLYKGPEARYCPAGVFEYVHEDMLSQGGVEKKAQGGRGERQADMDGPDGEVLATNYPQDLHRQVTKLMKKQVGGWAWGGLGHEACRCR